MPVQSDICAQILPPMAVRRFSLPRLRSLSLAAALCGTPSLAGAQGVAPAATSAAVADSTTITLEEALRLALEGNLGLARADLARAQQEVALAESRVALRPTIGLGTNVGQSFGRSLQELTLINGATTYLSPGVQAGLTIFDGGRARAEQAQALASLAAAGYNRTRLEQTVVYNVVQAFVNVLVRRQTLALQRQALADQEETLGRIVGLIDGGARPLADRYPLDAELAQAVYTVATAERDAGQAELDLIRLLRLDPRRPYRFVVPDVTRFDSGVDVAQMDFEALVARALATRADVQALDASAAAAQQAERLVRVGTMPRVNASFQYGTSASSGFERTEFNPATGQITSTPISFFEQLDQRRSGSFGLSLSLPVFDGGATRVARQRARIAIADARLSADERREEVAAQVRQALLDLRAAEQQVASATLQVEAARRALAAAEDRYRFGIGTVYDIAQARSALLRAESGLLTARTTRIVQTRVLDFQTGAFDVSSFTR